MILTKPSTEGEHHVQFFILNLVVHKEAARLEKVKYYLTYYVR